MMTKYPKIVAFGLGLVVSGVAELIVLAQGGLTAFSGWEQFLLFVVVGLFAGVLIMFKGAMQRKAQEVGKILRSENRKAD